MLLPNGMLIGGGKDGQLFVLSQNNLAASPVSFQAFFNTFHWGPNPYPYNSPTPYPMQCPPASPYGVADLYMMCYIPVSNYQDGESFGPNIHTGPVEWQDSANHAFIYKMAEKDYLKAFDYNISSRVVGQTPAHVATVRPGNDGMPGGFSSVSANQQRDGIVWTVAQQANSMYGSPTNAILYAHNASNLVQLWSNESDQVPLAKFTAPTVADGLVVLPSFNLFRVYGISSRPPGAPRQLQSLQADIEAKWVNMGGAAGVLGVPIGEVRREGSTGFRRDFRSVIPGGGYGAISVPPSIKIQLPTCVPHSARVTSVPVESSIFASRLTGAHFVIGEIRRVFLDVGGTRRLGYPLTDEAPTPDGFGRMSRFQKDTIFWYPGHGAALGKPNPPPPNIAAQATQSHATQ